MDHLVAYAIALPLMLAADAVWLGLAVPLFYRRRIGRLLRQPPRWGAAALFYLVYPAGLVFFAVSTGFDSGGPTIAAFHGLLFGFFTYFTYNATNLAVMDGYDALVAAIDTAWGSLMGMVVAALTVEVLARVSPLTVG